MPLRGAGVGFVSDSCTLCVCECVCVISFFLFLACQLHCDGQSTDVEQILCDTRCSGYD